ncbi:serine-rich adhesin for platelets [Lucilia sericata]|uniref:serine-rich adhesin for platelets n=1 Tax=Lucilia sericata TaxID=13632 RepID=UPI0018A81A01|nr:serine-rich adhesin for platelets [Lucilia sericata]XP_037813442.1 serine-rich adhesin for platelets [Lucilia sericata]XP_037813443.1 serine-rich adhesin for platelets [Lucilia sericata]
MSIAAAENAGLGPSDLPNHWASTLSTATKSSTSTTQTETDFSTNITNNFTTNSTLSATATTTTISTQTSAPTNTTPETEFSSAAINNICKLPRSSPTAATAAVTVSNAGSAVLGLAPVVPTSAGVVPLPTTIGSVGSAGGGGGAATTSSIIANHRTNTTTTDSINSVSPTAAANVLLARFSALHQHHQQQQQHNVFLNNNHSLLNNSNNLLPLHLQHHQQQQHPSLHKAATTAANIAAALQRSANMNAVASPISTNSTTSSNRKIRRKNDSKANLPQSQINKCNNEKRRRELENNYIEQLSEFLQLNKRGDMSSTKPDKAAILNQVVKTYRDICDRGQSRDISSSSSTPASTGTTTSPSTTTSLSTATSGNSTITNNNSNNQNTSTRCSRCATDNCSIHPVQQGEVSSTEPPLPEPSLLNGQVPEISAYFEALEHYISSVGWVLLQVNSAGIIESCTQNIRELIGYEKQELYRQPLYMYLYPGDHAKLDPIISNMSSSSLGGGNGSGGSGNGNIHDVNSAWGLGGETEDHTSNCSKPERSNSTKVRMLVKDIRSSTQTSGSSTTTNNDNSNSMDQKPKYEEVVLMAAPVKDDGDSTSVLCLITRPEDESPLEMNIQQHVQHPTIEQVTFKLDIHGKIITLDATTLREPFKMHLSQWSGRLLQDLCHPQDLSALKTHLRDIQDSTAGLNALNASQSPGSGVGINPPISNVTSKPFRLRLGAPDVYVHVKANSRLFINHTPGESDFIMSVQTLLNTESDMNSNNTGMMSGNSGLLTTGMAAMSPGSSLVSSLVSNLSMDSFVNNNSVSSPLVNVSGLGGLVGGGGMPPHTTQTTNVGGPLMTSAVINGTGGGVSGSGGGGPVTVNSGSGISSQRAAYTTTATSGVASNNSSLVNSFTASPAGHEGPSFYSNEFDLDLPHSSFEIDPSVSAWNDSRPNSRASVTTPVSTPRPPSAGHGFSPAVCPSPSTPYQLSSHSAASLPSPQSNASQTGPAVSGGPGPFGFGFPAFESNSEKVDKDGLNNNNGNSNNSNMPSVSGVSITGNVSNGGSNQLMLGSGGGSLLPTNQQQQAQPQQQQQQHNTTQKPPTESERLRHLLTNKAHPSATNSILGPDGDDTKFYKQEEDKESLQSNMPGMFKMGQGPIGHGAMGTSRMFNMQKSNSSNPMLLSLLKSEDDEKGGPSMGRSGDMVRVKDEPHGSHGGAHSNPNNLSPEDLRRILKHQGDPAMTRKRSLNDPDDGLSAKRSDDRPSKLCENNKMLARLLRNPPKNISMNIPTGIKIIPDKVPVAVGRVSSTLSGLSAASSCSSSVSSGMSSMSNKSSAITTMAGSGAPAGPGRGRGQHKHQQQHTSDVYLTQQQQQQQQGLDPIPGGTNLQRPPQSHQQTHGQMEFSSSSSSTVDHPFATPPLNTTAPSTTSTSTSSATTGTPLAGLGDGDSELSKILDSVMDYVSDDQSFAPSTPTGLTPQQINERLAISEIQKSLMVETSAFRNGPNAIIGSQTAQQMLQQQMQQQQQHSQLQPPAYPGSGIPGAGGNTNSMTPQQLQQQQQMQVMRMQQMLENMRANQNFQRPPPNYPTRGRAPAMNAVATPGGSMSATQRYRTLAQQQIVQQQKERLLQQQQKQHMLVPENATARNDQLCLNPNIGTLLNTVAPNVTLSRTNMPPDSQLSPNFAQTMMQQQLSPGQRNANFSPQSNTGYGPQYSQSGQRLSPQQQLSQQASAQQAQMAFQNSNAAQLSPRQPHFGNQGPNTPANANIPSPGIAPNVSPQQWSAQAPVNPQQRAHSLQQHNPMLSAQLQGVSPYNARQYQQRGRSLNSPSGAMTTGPGVTSGPQGPAAAGLQRQNSFQTNDGGGFANTTPNSPSPQSPYGGGSVFQQQQNQQQQMQRMQRQTSMPQASQHLPAGNPASSDYVKQELRAVVSGRAAAAANSGGNGVPGGGNGPGGGGIPSGLRVATPQSPHGPQTSQGPMLGTNSTNSMAMTQQQQPQTSISSGNVSNNSTVVASSAGNGSGGSNINNALLNTPPDPTMGFSFDPQDFFGSNSAR